MLTITKEFKFEAAHHLPLMPDGHPCKRLHGHSYRVVVELQGEGLDQYGFVRDYHDLKVIGDWLDRYCDHRDLTEVFGPGNSTTAERMAFALFLHFKRVIPELSAITICETAKTSATYRDSAEAWSVMDERFPRIDLPPL